MLDYLTFPSPTTVQVQEGDPLDLSVYNNQGIGFSYKLVNTRTETSVTDWFVVPDDPAVLQVPDIEEGTYQLFARGWGFQTDSICQNSIAFNQALNGFTVIYETVTSTLNSKTSEFKVYPQSCYKLVRVEIPENLKNAELQVTDLSGAVVLSQTTSNNSGTYKLEINKLANGLYLIKMITSEGVKVESFVKN